ncbi:hypothetical protein K6U06_16430 [Acidiferrimicrobium sp. IK]|uniref:hypothetical protein n=1 Tax=Acidiferrimicrobium sp. IK TaxID=2871700 RepID=UPI0021CB56B6|nr:hypothetical protein [Acidiferrimicrobium sp. IK]MCU4185959.1 hypothetical protein [Acidiferrimicrobium sp. IK]
MSGSRTSFAANQALLLDQSASYLRIGETVDPGNTSGYPAAVGELVQLAGLPETGDTPAQMALAKSDIAALDSFFATPGAVG